MHARPGAKPRQAARSRGTPRGAVPTPQEDHGQEGYERGMKTRRKVLGDDWVDRAEHEEQFNAEFQELSRYAWEEIWNRPELDHRTPHDRHRAVRRDGTLGGVQAALAGGAGKRRPLAGRPEGSAAANRRLLRRADSQHRFSRCDVIAELAKK